MRKTHNQLYVIISIQRAAADVSPNIVRTNNTQKNAFLRRVITCDDRPPRNMRAYRPSRVQNIVGYEFLYLYGERAAAIAIQVPGHDTR